MKKTGILLLSLIVWVGVYAQSDTIKDSLNQSISQDSIINLVENDKLDAKEAILLQKLTPEQIMSLENKRLENQKADNMPFSTGQLFVIVMAPFILIILIILLSGFYKDKESERKHELFMKSLEAGQPVPEFYFKGKEKKKASSLQTGLISTGIGAALVISRIFMNIPFFVFIGLLLLFFGIALTAYHFLSKPKNTTAAQDEQ